MAESTDQSLSAAEKLPLEVDRAEAALPKQPEANEAGWAAWLQVSAAFFLYWNSLGLLNGFGAFQSYYETYLLRGYTPSTISWIGTVQAFFLMAGGLFLGPLYDLGHARTMLAAGTLLVVAGFVFTSFSSSYYQVLLAQGFCAGIGTSCLYMPAVTLVPAYFPGRGPGSRRAMAMGTAAIGSSLGATIYPLMLAQLQPRVGFGWAVRAMALVVLVMCSYATAIARPRQRCGPPAGPDSCAEPLLPRLRRLLVAADLLDARYLVQCSAIFCSNVGFFEPIYYLQSYAEAHGMAGQSLAAYLLVILNAVSVPGRILPSWVADRVGVRGTYIAISALASASVFYWISVTTRAGNIAFAVLYGFFAGSVVTLAPVVLASITDDLSVLGTRLGCVALLKGIGSLVGAPAAGAILRASGSYLGVQLFAAVMLMLTAMLAGVLQLVVRRHRKLEAAI